LHAAPSPASVIVRVLVCEGDTQFVPATFVTLNVVVLPRRLVTRLSRSACVRVTECVYGPVPVVVTPVTVLVFVEELAVKVLLGPLAGAHA
jgi:hypothetical protein